MEGIVYDEKTMQEIGFRDFMFHKDHTLDEQQQLDCPLDNGGNNATPRYDLGDLDLLPLELLNDILVQVDLRSLTDFRRVNRRAIKVVDSIPQYNIIVSHAPLVLRGILAIEAGTWFSCAQLYRGLCTPNCEDCDDFGGYLYLITCKRLCFLCLTEEERYLPLLPSEAIRKFGLNQRLLSTLPHIRSIPGSYSVNNKICRQRLTLIDSESARLSGIALHGSVSQMEQFASQARSRQHQQYLERLRLWESGLSERKPRQKQIEDAFDQRDANPKRFMAAVRAAAFDPRTKALEWGVYCVGCQDDAGDCVGCDSESGFHCVGCESESGGRILHWRRMFTIKSLIQHIKHYGRIDEEYPCHIK